MSENHEVRTFSQNPRENISDVVVGSLGGFLLILCFTFIVLHIRDRETSSRRTSFADKPLVLQIANRLEDGDVPARSPRKRKGKNVTISSNPIKNKPGGGGGVSFQENVEFFADSSSPSSSDIEQTIDMSEYEGFQWKGKFGIKMNTPMLEEEVDDNAATTATIAAIDTTAGDTTILTQDSKEMEESEGSSKSSHSNLSVLANGGLSSTIIVTDLHHLRSVRDLQNAQLLQVSCPSYFMDVTSRDLFWIDSQGDMHRLPRVDHRVNFANVTQELRDTYLAIAEIESIFVVEDMSSSSHQHQEVDEESQTAANVDGANKTQADPKKGFGQLLQSMFSSYLPPILECPSLEDLIQTPINSPHHLMSVNGSPRSVMRKRTSSSPKYSPGGGRFEITYDQLINESRPNTGRSNYTSSTAGSGGYRGSQSNVSHNDTSIEFNTPRKSGNSSSSSESMDPFRTPPRSRLSSSSGQSSRSGSESEMMAITRPPLMQSQFSSPESATKESSRRLASPVSKHSSPLAQYLPNSNSKKVVATVPDIDLPLNSPTNPHAGLFPLADEEKQSIITKMEQQFESEHPLASMYSRIEDDDVSIELEGNLEKNS